MSEQNIDPTAVAIEAILKTLVVIEGLRKDGEPYAMLATDRKKFDDGVTFDESLVDMARMAGVRVCQTADLKKHLASK